MHVVLLILETSPCIHLPPRQSPAPEYQCGISSGSPLSKVGLSVVPTKDRQPSRPVLSLLHLSNKQSLSLFEEVGVDRRTVCSCMAFASPTSAGICCLSDFVLLV
jgi:hypothetical protein